MTNRKIAHYDHFLLLPQCVLENVVAEQASKNVCVLEWGLTLILKMGLTNDCDHLCDSSQVRVDVHYSCQ